MRKHLEEKELLHIGILGIDKGEGVTSLAVGMASYLQGMRCKKTAMLEMNTEGEFADIRTTYFGKTIKKRRLKSLKPVIIRESQRANTQRSATWDMTAL